MATKIAVYADAQSRNTAPASRQPAACVGEVEPFALYAALTALPPAAPHDVSMHRFALVGLLVTTAHAETLDARFVPAIRAAAQGYAKWGRVDERPNIAPGLCRAPMPGDYGSTGDVRLTRADDDSPHGKKLYYLYASAKPAYLGLAAKDAPLPAGFAIVKQSWTPRSASKAEIDERQRISREHERTLQMSERYVQPGRSWVVADGHYLVADQQRDLFVMTKVGAASGTDAGWVYGTVAPDGSVTSAGRVARCMGCHEAAPHERLFGLAKEPPGASLTWRRR